MLGANAPIRSIIDRCVYTLMSPYLLPTRDNRRGRLADHMYAEPVSMSTLMQPAACFKRTSDIGKCHGPLMHEYAPHRYAVGLAEMLIRQMFLPSDPTLIPCRTAYGRNATCFAKRPCSQRNEVPCSHLLGRDNVDAFQKFTSSGRFVRAFHPPAGVKHTFAPFLLSVVIL